MSHKCGACPLCEQEKEAFAKMVEENYDDWASQRELAAAIRARKPPS